MTYQKRIERGDDPLPKGRYIEFLGALSKDPFAALQKLGHHPPFWVDDPNDLAVDSSRLGEAIIQIKKFLPSVKEEAIVPDYAGIRPKLGKNSAVAAGKGFMDFVIRKEDGYEGFVNLLGIESPGLTSSLAIAEMVEGLLYK